MNSKLSDMIEARVFPQDREYIQELCALEPDAYPNESAVIRAALHVFRRWRAEQEVARG